MVVLLTYPNFSLYKNVMFKLNMALMKELNYMTSKLVIFTHYKYDFIVKSSKLIQNQTNDMG